MNERRIRRPGERVRRSFTGTTRPSGLGDDDRLAWEHDFARREELVQLARERARGAEVVPASAGQVPFASGRSRRSRWPGPLASRGRFHVDEALAALARDAGLTDVVVLEDGGRLLTATV